MIPSIMCKVPPFVELLGPQVSNPDPQISNKIDAAGIKDFALV